MAISQIITECKRYGCMKNLLACYANCRYNTRCDDLRGELADKTEQAERDINEFLRERGQKPIQIKTLARGLRFIPLSVDVKKSAASVKKEKPARAARSVKRLKRKRKKKQMPAKSEQSLQKSASVVSEKPAAQKKAKRKPSARKPAGSSVKARDGKLYIILEGDTATVVDQHGLMQRMMTKSSSSARYFEAHEVEARIQIVPKR
ncbi:MAG: hypothetical protein AB1631_10480 [Acidobacteriota bacterium]